MSVWDRQQPRLTGRQKSGMDMIYCMTIEDANNNKPGLKKTGPARIGEL